MAELRQLIAYADGESDRNLEALFSGRFHPDARSSTSRGRRRAAAKLIFGRYVPNKAHLRAAFATQASRAEQREPQLVTDKAALDLLPVEGGTAHDVATAYVQAGIELGMLLSGRAEVKGQRADALSLRTQALADISTLRSMIARVHAGSPDRGAAVDRKLFNYLDTLCDLRDSGSKAPTPPPPVDADPVAT